jgi:hypothetical protein
MDESRERVFAIELRGAQGIVYLAVPPTLDTRSVLAFMFGQCHGLALALTEETGLPLVGVISPTGDCRHVGVERPDGRLLDATGSHSLAEIEAQVPGAKLVPIGEDGIALLVSEHGWAVPETAAAKSWVGSVLAIADGVPLLPPLAAHRMRKTWETGDLTVLIEWQGRPQFAVFIRPSSQEMEAWTSYGTIQFPRDPVRDIWLIDFSKERFEELAIRWLEREFDSGRAATLVRGSSAAGS